MVTLRISVRKDLHRQQKLDDAGLSCFSSAADPNGKRKGLAAEFTIRQQVPLLVFSSLFSTSTIPVSGPRNPVRRN